MIKTLTIALCFFTLSARAGHSVDIMRGGFGFLFGDTSFIYNPGQMALTKGFVAQGAIQSTIETPKTLLAMPSLAYGNGSYSFGAYALRVGTHLTNPGESVTTGGAVAGVATSDRSLTAGVGYITGLANDTTGISTAEGYLNYNGGRGRGKGAAVGVKYAMGLGGVATTKAVTFAAGYAFQKNVAMEVNILNHNLDDLSDWTLSGHFTWAGKKTYLGLGGSMYRYTGSLTGMARFGFIFPQYDLSVYGSYNDASSPVVGGTFRFFF